MRHRHTTNEVIIAALLALALTVLINAYAFNLFYVPSNSMAPVIKKGDTVLLLRVAYRFPLPWGNVRTGEVKRGDVVVFRSPYNARKRYVKRVARTQGEHAPFSTTRAHRHIGTRPIPIPLESNRVPENTYFMVGDNEQESVDSRTFGCVEESAILGRVIFIVFPLSRAGAIAKQ